jgi:hypothetical protein
MKKENSFSWRIFVSTGLFISLFVVFLSGIILYLVPPARVSNWINWKLLGLNKSSWEELHTIFSFLFAILAFFHALSINWRTFLAYLKQKTRRIKEFSYAIALSVVVFVSTLYHLPPVVYLITFGEYLSDIWSTPQNKAPLYNAEKYSLEELVLLLPNLNIDTLQTRLKKNNIKFENTAQNLQEIAEQNQTSAHKLYLLLTEN